MKIWKIIFWAIIIIAIILSVVIKLTSPAKANPNPGTNIDPDNTDERYAWNDNMGWIDFHGSHNANVGTSTLWGYANSDDERISLNCNTTPEGDVCSSSDFKVTNPEAAGYLSGCAWNDEAGWISFWCGDGNCDGSNTEDASSTCSSSNYRVTINASGTFSGYAWNDVNGWISFNCSNDSSCGTIDYKVTTSWVPGRMVGYLTSSIIDTQSQRGATLNSIAWQGTQPSGTSMDFQIAGSNSTSGPWSYLGPSGSATSYYGRACPSIGASDPAAGPDTPICVDRSLTANYRYLRYKLRLQSNTSQDKTPTINKLVLNWSK